MFRHHLVNCNSKCRVWFFYAGFFSSWCARIERQKQEYGTARPFPITLSWFPCTVFCCGFCQKVLGLEIRCVLSLWKGPRNIENIVWDFFTGMLTSYPGLLSLEYPTSKTLRAVLKTACMLIYVQKGFWELLVYRGFRTLLSSNCHGDMQGRQAEFSSAFFFLEPWSLL